MKFQQSTLKKKQSSKLSHLEYILLYSYIYIIYMYIYIYIYYIYKYIYIYIYMYIEQEIIFWSNVSTEEVCDKNTHRRES